LWLKMKEEYDVEGFVVEKMALVGGGDGRPRSLVVVSLLLELAGNKGNEENEGER